MAGTRFPDLRGLRWRIDLGVLPRNGSIDNLRRVTADNRRKYASLRRRLLIDPHLAKDGERSANIVVDNPLSQNPESTWGQFFKNAELERVIDQDLSRLYPENGSYFQSSACQSMLRRILMLWCLLHSNYGYRQGMHELLAPLVYVLHVDLDHLSSIQKLHKDCFSGELDGVSLLENVSPSKFRETDIWERGADKLSSLGDNSKVCNLDELDPDMRDILLLSDSYGAEGELGNVLSERFMEHDAYCMFDGLMNGGTGVVAMADFFQSSAIGSSCSLPPVIEASSALYHLLSIVDPSLHSHLVDLGVEPQYFALRWLRVLFGREFCLSDLMVIWDEILSAPNFTCMEKDIEFSFKILCCSRGALIAALAVSMLLHVRSSLLATEHATSCLQRLLNFPENPDLKKLIAKAKVYQVIAIEANVSSSSSGRNFSNNKMMVVNGYNLPSGSLRLKTPAKSVLDSYWEEKWRLLQANEALKKSNTDAPPKGRIKKFWDEKLAMTESDPFPATVGWRNDCRTSVKRSLLDDFSHGSISVGNNINHEQNVDPAISDDVESLHSGANDTEQGMEETVDQNAAGRTSGSTIEEALSGEISSVFSAPSSPHSLNNDNENESDKSSVTSISSTIINDGETINEESCSQSCDCQPVQVSDADAPKDERQEEQVKDQKPFGGKFLWFWNFNKGPSVGNSEKSGSQVSEKLSVAKNVNKDSFGTAPSEGIRKLDVPEKKVIGTLKNLGQSMLENIQVIESIFQQDRGHSGSLGNFSNGILGGKRQVTAMTALKELRKISNLLQEM